MVAQDRSSAALNSRVGLPAASPQELPKAPDGAGKAAPAKSSAEDYTEQSKTEPRDLSKVAGFFGVLQKSLQVGILTGPVF